MIEFDLNEKLISLTICAETQNVACWVEDLLSHVKTLLKTSKISILTLNSRRECGNLNEFHTILQETLQCYSVQLQEAFNQSFRTLEGSLEKLRVNCEELHHNVSDFEEKVTNVRMHQLPLKKDLSKNLSTLGQVDRVKRRFSACRSLMTLLLSWDKVSSELEKVHQLIAEYDASDPCRVKEYEKVFTQKENCSQSIDLLMTEGLNQHFDSFLKMKKASHILKKFPEFSSKCSWLETYEKKILLTCSSKLSEAIPNKLTESILFFISIFEKIKAFASLEEILRMGYSNLLTNAFCTLYTNVPIVKALQSKDDRAWDFHIEDSNFEWISSYYETASAIIMNFQNVIETLQPRQLLWNVTGIFASLLKNCMTVPFVTMDTLFNRLVQQPHQYQNILIQIPYYFEKGIDLFISTSISLSLFQSLNPTMSLEKQQELMANEHQNVLPIVLWKQFCSENASCLFSNKFITLTLTSFETRLQTEMQKKVGYKHSGPYISSQTYKNHLESTQHTLTCLEQCLKDMSTDSVSFSLDQDKRETSFLMKQSLFILFAVDRIMFKYWKEWLSVMESILQNMPDVHEEEYSVTENILSSFQEYEMCQLKNQQLIEKLRLWKDVHEYLILNVLVSFITLMKTLYNQCIEMDETSSYFTTASTIALKQYTPPDSQRNPLLSLLPATKVSLNPTHLCEADFNFFRSCNFPSIEEFFLLITQTRQKLIHHAFMPLESVLKAYPNLSLWQTDQSDTNDNLPTNILVSISEYLLFILHFFEKNDQENTFLPEDLTIAFSLRQDFDVFLNKTIEAYCTAVSQIQHTSCYGKKKLLCDMYYFERSCSLLGHNTDLFKQHVSLITQEKPV